MTWTMLVLRVRSKDRWKEGFEKEKGGKVYC